MRRLIIFTGNALIGACWVLFCQVNAVKLLVIMLIVQIQKVTTYTIFYVAIQDRNAHARVLFRNDPSGNYVTNRFDQKGS